MLAICVLTACPAWAQSAQGPIFTGIVGAMVADAETNVSLSASAGYRFNSVMGLGVEFTFVPTLQSERPFAIASNPYGLPSLRFGGPDGHATIFTTNLRLEMPTASTRVVPFAVAGGGVANLRERYELSYPFPSPFLFSEIDDLGLLPPLPRTQALDRSTVAMALTLGGGVSVLAGEHLSIDLDLRYLRLLGETDRNVGRFGGGVSYRF